MNSLKRRLLNYVPEGLKEHVKLLAIRRRYPDCDIGSHLILPTVKLGRRCMIPRQVVISDGVTIGDYSYVNSGAVIASGSIGKFCSIGYSVQIGLPSHPAGYISTSPRTYGSENIFGVPMYWNDYSAPPVIENDVWIGSNALIMQNVRVCNGAIVAAGAVVTHDVPPYTIVAGIPATALRKRFSEDVIDQLLAWRWWDLPIEQLREFRELFELGNQAVSNLTKAAK